MTVYNKDGKKTSLVYKEGRLFNYLLKVLITIKNFFN